MSDAAKPFCQVCGKSCGIYCDDCHKALLPNLTAHERALVDATVEKCCKAVCATCRCGHVPVERDGTWYHLKGKARCCSTAIRRMVAGQ